MRISDIEHKLIVDSAKQIFGDDVIVYLFGSRVDDQKKGGDIDLYIEPSLNYDSKDILAKKINYITDLQLKIGDQKIDVIVYDKNIDRLIYKVAVEEGVKLC